MATAVKQHRCSSAGSGSTPRRARPGDHQPGDRRDDRRGAEGDARRTSTARSRRAQTTFDETWSDSTPSERQRALLKLADLVEEHGEELGRIEAENVGKVYSLVMSEEIPVIADNFRFFAGGARMLEGRAAGEYMKGFTASSDASRSAWPA